MAAKVVDMSGAPYGSYEEYVEKSYAKPYILQELANRARDSKKYGTQLEKISHQRHIPVFVYDEFQPDGKFNEVFDGCPYLGKAHSGIAAWVMDLGPDGSPLVYRVNPNHMHSARVVGHVYLVTPKVLLSLDCLYENTIKMERETKWVYLQNQSYPTKDGGKRPSIKVNVYTRKADFWKGVHMDQINPVMSNTGHSVYEYKCKKPKTFEELYKDLDDHKALPTLFNSAAQAQVSQGRFHDERVPF